MLCILTYSASLAANYHAKYKSFSAKNLKFHILDLVNFEKSSRDQNPLCKLEKHT